MKGGRPSETALLIAKSTVTTAANSRIGTFVTTEAAETCEWFLRDHLLFGRLRLGLFRSAWYQAYQRALESQIIPGIQLHYAIAKAAVGAICTNIARAQRPTGNCPGRWI